MRSNLNMGLDMSGGSVGAGKNGGSVPSFIVVVAQGNFLLVDVNKRSKDRLVCA